MRHTLSFNPEGVRKLLDHAETASEHPPLYYQQESGAKVAPGLWLVGDEGVYLMSNGSPRQMADGTVASAKDAEGRSFVVYAEGISPEDEDWYETKRRVFGGDDGADYIGAASVRAVLGRLKPGRPFRITLSPTQIKLG